ncbi:hypothetical protein C2S51_031387 [Perilla frutescens var. frutescens]|nr:hypothetical protein C2S51_031387 [Perilla frutescens var. frutescens]
MMGMEWLRIVDGALSRYVNGCGQSSKRAIHHTPILPLVYWRTTSSTPTIARLNREDMITCINYDSAFSQWKIIIGDSDWKDHSSGKEGAERYRTQNLPNYTSPGLYELGIATSAVGGAKEPRKLNSSSVIPVYLGQADNVRARVQNYGRGGAHLESESHSLFSGIFSIGFPIAYRWAPTRSKEEAERREKELLLMYDYAWNKRNNGDRRDEEIQRRLISLMCCAKTSLLLSILRRHFQQNILELGDKQMKSGERFSTNRISAMMGLQTCKEARSSAICRKLPAHGRKERGEGQPPIASF